jgi:uncharacterized membrane protein
MSGEDRSRSVADPASNHESNDSTLGRRLHRFLVPVPKLGPPINPALLKREQERAERRQNRLADGITTFAGSMLFVYVHVIWFGCWIGFGVEDYPYGLLTMIVSLEAIFLSTFVLISQNRADAKRQVIADQQWQTVREEDEQNVELLDLSRQILTLTKRSASSHARSRIRVGVAAGRRDRTDPAPEVSHRRHIVGRAGSSYGSRPRSATSHRPWFGLRSRGMGGCPVPSVPRLVPPGASKPLRGTPLPGALCIECRVLQTNWSRTWVAGVV